MSQSLRQGQTLDVVLTSQRPTETTQPIGLLDLDLLFNCFCRFPAFFAEARQVLKEHHFDPGAELPYSLVFRALQVVTDKYGEPNNEVLVAEVGRYVQELAGTLPESLVMSILRQDGQGLIYSSMFSVPDATTLSFGRAILQRFLHERTVVFPLRRMLSYGMNGAYSAELPSFLEAIDNQRGAIKSLQTMPRVVAPAFGTPIARPPQTFKLMGMFFDETLEGQRIGDVNGMIGVIGAGKTTTGVHMATCSAKQAFREAQQQQKVPELTIFITAEESGEKVLPRFQSAAFQIPYRKLATLQDWGHLTTQANLEPYEHQLAIAGEGRIYSESERYLTHYPWFRDCLEIFDMSGSQAFPHAGEGFVPELVANIEALLRARGNQPLRTVVIDWVGILVQRHMGAIGASENDLRHYIAKFINECRRNIAEKFGCTVWALHQIKTSLITASPTKLFHHGDAAEASAFAAELTVCGCIGVPDKETGCRRINFSKVRYKAGEEVPPLTVKIHRHFSMIEDVGMRYAVDDSGTRFVTSEDRARIHGASAARTRSPSAGPPGLRRTTDPDDDLGVQQ